MIILRFALAGLAQTAITLVAAFCLTKLANLFFYDVLNSMASLLLSPVIALPIIVISLAVGMFTAYRILRDLQKSWKMWATIASATLLSIGATILLFATAFAGVNLPVSLYVIAGAAAVSYAVTGLLHSNKMPLPAVWITLTIVAAATGTAGFITSSRATDAAHLATLDNLDKAGYRILAPSPESGFTITKIVSTSNGNSDYTAGTTLYFEYLVKGRLTYSSMEQSKYSGIAPETECDAYTPPHSYATSDTPTTCTLYRQVGEMSIYKHTEAVPATDTLKPEEIHRYFAVSHGTLIFAEVSETNDDDEANAERAVEFYESLRPVSADYIKRTFDL